MKRKEFSFFLKNVPGELGRLTSLLKKENIRIEAMTIQDASAYVKALYNARGKSLKRIASTASYESMLRDSNEFALVRLLVDQTEKAAELLAQNDYFFEITPVIALYLDGRSGAMTGDLSEIASRLGEEGVNINTIYGSIPGPDERCLFVFSPEDIDRAAKCFE
ncbi:MAG: amino acid-binding protein [Deltaproteobacteria bacterium]|nr:amino acid-binding protein [Deltaproteobacteria bacterium]